MREPVGIVQSRSDVDDIEIYSMGYGKWLPATDPHWFGLRDVKRDWRFKENPLDATSEVEYTKDMTTTATEAFTTKALENLAVEAVSKGSVLVESTTRANVVHRVFTYGHEVVGCSCEDCVYRGNKECKHQTALRTIITNHYPARPRKVVSAGSRR